MFFKKFLKRLSPDRHRLKWEKKNKSCKYGIYTENLNCACYCVIFEFFDCREIVDSGGCYGKPK